MVERFNGRISDLLKTHHFVSREDLEETLLRYVHLYNHQLPQSAEVETADHGNESVVRDTHPALFKKGPYNRAGVDNDQG
jgi:hypothetical protein